MNALRILVNNLFKKSFYLVSMALYKIRYNLCSGDTTCNSLKKKNYKFFLYLLCIRNTYNHKIRNTLKLKKKKKKESLKKNL